VTRTRIGGSLHTASHLIFGVLLVLGCLSTSWRDNPFLNALHVQVRWRGQAFDVPVVLILPLAVLILWPAGVYLQRSWGEVATNLRGRWAVVVPAFGFGILTLIRVYPVHIPLKARIAWGNVLIFWLVFLYAWLAWPSRWAWATFGGLLVIQGAVAVLQFALQGPIGLPVVNEVAPYPTASGASVIEASGRRWLRAYGLTPHPNVLGGYLGMMVCFVAGAWLASPRTRRWLLAPLSLGAAGIFVSFSRSAWLGLGAAGVYAMALLRPWTRLPAMSAAQRRRWMGIAAGVGLALIVLGAAFQDLLITRFLRLGNPLESASIRERIRDAGQAWMLIRNRPLRGVGTGTYIEALWAWANATGRAFPAFQHVHNVPLLAAAELGVGGALLWLWFVAAPWVDGMVRSRGSTEGAFLAVGVGAAFVVALVVGMTDYFLYLPTTLWPALYLGVLGGLAARPALGAGEEAV
jgi:O-antigen ligase